MFQLFKPSICLLLLASLVLLSCQKQVLKDNTCSCSNDTSFSEVKNLLTAHPWQINEVIDPFSGTRYKRGVLTDGKDFATARYLYKENGTLTGNTWQGSIANTCYTLLDNRKIQVCSPPCIDIYNVISIGATEYSYKDNSGTIFILGPVEASETTGHK
ncbi:hypothetical protein [Flavisolibacter tropicus]|uniref:hypothetical protein n=1 Tax=Flavisolibacter tropicus TaxID=1492898 RepID=UPI0011DFED97|nr:hypothetical protein [Flavisolibacter tropicus]